MELEENKFSKWAKEIFDNATAHGWHEEQHSPEHYLGLIMTEVAEAVEADRKNLRANNERFEDEMNKANARNVYKPESIDIDAYFFAHYNACIKSSIEEEFADIVIRLLDMAYALYGESMSWETWPGVIPCPRKYYSFVVNAWNLISLSLDRDPCDICSSIDYVYKWAEILDIDLDQHIEWKMRYNTLRSYKHGGKRY
jgi:NTP pyrophosphatase (non-canonical NTP hydrolase)